MKPTLSTVKSSLKSNHISLIPAILLILLVACKDVSTDTNTLIFEGFPSITNLIGEEVRIPVNLLKPDRMIIVDTYLVVCQNLSDSIFTIFSLPDLRHLASFGSKGRGPDEFEDAWFSTSFKPVSSNKSVFAVGNHGTEVNYYNIQDVLDGIYAPYYVAKLPSEVQAFQALACFSDTLLIGMPFAGLGGKTHLFKYRKLNDSLEHFRGYPIDFPNLSNDERSNMFSCFLTVKADNSRFALIYGSTLGQIEIFDPSSNVPFKIVYKNYPGPFENMEGLNTNSETSFESSHVFSWESKSTNNYIYAKIFACEYDKISDGRQFLRSLIPEIHVFDWEGNPVRGLKPDRFYQTFAVDTDDRFLYTMHPDSANIIMKYDLQTIR